MTKSMLDMLHCDCIKAVVALRRGLKEYCQEREIDWRNLTGESVDDMDVQILLRSVGALKRIRDQK